MMLNLLQFLKMYLDSLYNQVEEKVTRLDVLPVYQEISHNSRKLIMTSVEVIRFLTLIK